MSKINSIKKFLAHTNISGAVPIEKNVLDGMIKKLGITDESFIGDLYGFFHIDTDA